MSFWGSQVDATLDRVERELPLIGGKLSLIEFDQDEYEALSEAARAVVTYPQHWYWSETRLHEARLIFLAFALEHVRHNTYLSDSAFWQEFEHSLGLAGMEGRRLIMNDLLWPSFEEFEVEKRTGIKNRLIVRSLMDEAVAQKLSHSQFEDFFVWYFRTCPISSVTLETLGQYERAGGKKLTILRQALQALDEDCRMLSSVVERVLDFGTPLAEIDMAELVPEALWERRFRAINGPERLKKLVAVLENRVTPEQFVRLVRHSAAATVVKPDGTRVRISSSSWLSLADIDFGSYTLGAQTYHVVPIRWLGLSDIDDWVTGSLVRRGRYVGYKKQSPFTVRVGSALGRSRKVWFRWRSAYLWFGPSMPGRPLSIDGHPVGGTTGLSAKVSLKLSHTEEDEPTIAVVFESIVANYPALVGKPFRAFSSQGHEFLESIRQDGTLVLKRVVVFRLDSFEQTVTVQCGVDAEEPFVHCFVPEEAFLFSEDTLDLIGPGSRRKWGGRRFCLFVRPQMPVEVSGGTAQETVSGIEGYQAFRIVWDSDALLDISAGDNTWHMESAAYCMFRVRADPVSPMVALGPTQVCSLADMEVEVITNLPAGDPGCALEVAYEGTRVVCAALSDCLVATSPPANYQLTHPFLKWLDAASDKQFGQYTVIVRDVEDIIGVCDIELVPRLSIDVESLKQLRPEGSVCVVRVSSSSTSIWDASSQKACSHVDLRINCNLDIDPDSGEFSSALPKPLVPRIQAVVLLFPEVNQTARLRLQPSVLGFRLYKRIVSRRDAAGESATYRGVVEADYSLLESTVLQVAGARGSTIRVAVEGIVALEVPCDEETGNTFADLGFLRAHCRRHFTWISLASGEAEVGFNVVWAPRVGEIRLVRQQLILSGSGPRDCRLILRAIDSDLKTLSERLFLLTGGDFEVSAQLSDEEVSRGRYVVPYYRLGDGTVLQSSSQLRLNRQAGAGFLARARTLSESIGVSESLAARQQVRDGGSSK